ncbi:hypothetical protein VZT92_012233 [Zoarces viviparus]|uniref:Secreted protein n=1 Tax=Zoarces viviparus TaxID=48416 RepID=A0AAW1F7P0_ZOAVI
MFSLNLRLEWMSLRLGLHRLKQIGICVFSVTVSHDDEVPRFEPRCFSERGSRLQHARGMPVISQSDKNARHRTKEPDQHHSREGCFPNERTIC